MRLLQGTVEKLILISSLAKSFDIKQKVAPLTSPVVMAWHSRHWWPRRGTEDRFALLAPFQGYGPKCHGGT
jgi:hypothetical protein